ncbi:hypothetical protein GCM10025734_76300 [Kitasatospora paranensis]
MHVGFVGLGTMGREMARQLLSAGHRVTVWNRSPEAVRILVGDGAEAAGSLSAALAAEAVVSMLADDAAVESLLLDDDLLAAATTTVHVNMATVSPELARRAAAQHAEHGIGYVAAPVMGRSDVAAAGNLAILAAGETPCWTPSSRSSTPWDAGRSGSANGPRPPTSPRSAPTSCWSRPSRRSPRPPPSPRPTDWPPATCWRC